MTKVMAFFLIFVVIFTLWPRNTPGAANDSLLNVVVRPIRVNSAATYILNVKFVKSIAATEWLKIQWPEGTKMPELPEDPNKRRAALEKLVESIYIGAFPCGSCNSPPVLNEKERSLSFTFPRNINPSDPEYTFTTIVIPDRLGFVNPEIAGSYTLQLITASHGTMVSAPYEIVESRIGVPEGLPEVSIDPFLPFTSASYSIEFNVGKGGGLISNQSRIRIRFPEETILSEKSSSGHSYWIHVNGVPLRASYAWNNHLLIIISPISTENSERVNIQISKEVGLVNPKKSGSYHLEVSTSEDREWVLSKPYTISATDIPLHIIPNKNGRKAAMNILFSIDEAWSFSANEALKISFPDNYPLPESIATNLIEINGEKPLGSQIEGKVLSIAPEKAVTTTEPVLISISEKAGLINPENVHSVQLHLKPFNSPQWYPTRIVALEEAALTLLKVHPTVWNACEISAYEIAMETGVYGQLDSSDWISLIFDTAYGMPTSLETSLITVNNRYVEAVSMVDTHEIKIYPGFDLEGYGLTIHLDHALGITNPCEGKQEYVLRAKSSKEHEIKESPLYFIAPPLPQVNAEWFAGKPGKNNWFQEPPTMKIRAVPSDAAIFFSWNDQPKDSFELYRGDQEMPDGFYRMELYFFAQDSYGDSEIQSIELNIDTLPPQFEIVSPPYPITYTNQHSFEISGIVEKQLFDDRGNLLDYYDLNLSIGDQSISVSSDNGHFASIIKLANAEEEVKVRLEDEAGWINEKTLIFNIDQTLPQLDNIYPPPSSTSLSRKIELNAQTRPFSEVWINQAPVLVNAAGKISHTLEVNQAGKHTFTIAIKDRFGNEHTDTIYYWFGLSITMQIGNKTIVANDASMINDVAPAIYDQSTYLPLRILSELMRAELEVTSHPISGKTESVVWKTSHHHIIVTPQVAEAIVNGEKQVMPAPPRIVENRLMMPVRWTIEQMGGTLQWDPKNQLIDISYLEPMKP